MTPVRIADVEVKDSDSNELFGCRTVKVQVHGSKSFTTPSKPITHRELLNKAETPEYRGVLPGQVVVIPEYIKGSIFEEYRNCNGRLKKIYGEVSLYSESSSFLINVPNLLTERINPRAPEAMATLKKQLEIPTLSAICLPLLDTDYEGFIQSFNAWKEQAERYGKGIVPQISMNEDINLFRKKLDFIKNKCDSGELFMIDFIYANPSDFTLQYSELWSRNKELNAILNLTNVPNSLYGINGYMKSIPRYDLLMYGFDMITPMRGRPTRYPNGKGPFDMLDVQKYSWSNYGIEANIDGRYWEAMDHDHTVCDCPICRKKTQTQIMDRYAYNVEGEITDSSFMKRISILHDHLSSTAELRNLSNAIKDQELSEYCDGIQTKRKDFETSVKIGNVREYR